MSRANPEGLLPDPAGHQAWCSRWGWLVIALAVVITYWPLSSFQFAVTHGDTLNCWLPWRWFIASCLQNDQLPLWNPHQQFGYPIHADLQGPTWYVEALALGGTVGHGLYTLQLLFLLYVMIGGWGMMRLIRTLFNDARIALIMGMAYALGGFFTGHQMHFYSIISAAWLPWSFDAAIRLFRKPGWSNAAYFALVQGLLLTGGNHTFTIIASYVLFALFIGHAFPRLRRDGWGGIRSLIFWCFGALVCAMAIGAGVLHAWWEVSPYIARSAGLSLEAASVHPLTFRALVSLLFPFGTGTDASWLGTDAPMANAFMGAITLPFAIAALFRSRSLVENILLVLGCVATIAAFGTATPVYGWLWAHAPGMDLFRFPSYFRWFAWLALLVLAAGSLNAYWSGGLGRRVLAVLVSITAAIALVIGVKALVGLEPQGQGLDLYERMRAMGLHRRLLYSAAVTVPVLIYLSWCAWRGKLGSITLVFGVLLEMGWNTSLAQWNTATSAIRPVWLEDRLSALNAGPVLPLEGPTKRDDDNGQRLHYLMHNTQDFLGGFSRLGFNSFWLKNAMALELDHAGLWNAMSGQPVAYHADRVSVQKDDQQPEYVMERDSALVLLAIGVPLPKLGPKNPLDRLQLTGFDNTEFNLKSHTEGDALVVLQQSHYPGWEVLVDQEPRVLLKANIAAMAVAVPAGDHVVTFRYRKPIVPWLMGLSLTVFLVLCGALAFQAPSSWAARLGFVGLAGMLAFSLFGHSPKRARVDNALHQLIKETSPKDLVVLNTDGGSTSSGAITGEQVLHIRADLPQHVGDVSEALGSAIGRSIVWVEAGIRADPTVRAFLLDHYEVDRVRELGGVERVYLKPSTQQQARRTLHLGSGPLQWICAAQQYGQEVTIPLDLEREERTGSLVIDMAVTSPMDARIALVVERKEGGQTTDYRTFPIFSKAYTDGPRPAYAVLPMGEVHRPGASLKIYLWSFQGDSVGVEHVRVGLAPFSLGSW